MKPSIKKENGRVDIKALRKRYENQATVQERINEANQTLETLVCKNERALSFEIFSGKLQDTASTLEECHRAPHNGDIVEKLRNKIHDSEFNSCV